jgi:multisubunit Na+/H+ antiporter MnhE subunit
MKIKEYIILLIVWFVELFAYQRWFGCWLFQTNFYFTKETLTIQLINATNADKGMPLLLVRALHNKALAFPWGLVQTLLQYFDVRFLIEFIGFIGAVGIALAIWYLCTKARKNYFFWGVFVVTILICLIEMFFQPHIVYAWKMIGFGIVYQLLSLFGIWMFIKSDNKHQKLRYGFIVALCLVTLLSVTLFPLMYQMFCLKI